jgi:hypothetical protein
MAKQVLTFFAGAWTAFALDAFHKQGAAMLFPWVCVVLAFTCFCYADSRSKE